MVSKYGIWTVLGVTVNWSNFQKFLRNPISFPTNGGIPSPICGVSKSFIQSRYQEVVLGPEWIPGLLDAEGAAVRAELGVSWLVRWEIDDCLYIYTNIYIYIEFLYWFCMNLLFINLYYLFHCLISVWLFASSCCLLFFVAVAVCWFFLFQMWHMVSLLTGRGFLRGSSKFQTREGLDANKSVPERKNVVSIGGGFNVFQCSFLFRENNPIWLIPFQMGGSIVGFLS